MKKLAIYIIVLGIAFSYSCKKDKIVNTTISGTLITNGTNDPIIISTELPYPIVILFHRTFSGGQLLTGSYIATEVARTTVNYDGEFSFNLELYEDNEYFLGYCNINTSLYYYTDADWKGHQNYYPIASGSSNSNIKVFAPAFSWVQPRFINTNPDPNNQDVFQYFDGIGGGGGPTPNNPLIYGSTDTTMSWIHGTWSGQNLEHEMPHQVKGKLTRNGVTIDTIIPYNAPPFDTTIVEIRY